MKNGILEEDTVEYTKLKAKPDVGWILTLSAKNTREVLDLI